MVCRPRPPLLPLSPRRRLGRPARHSPLPLKCTHCPQTGITLAFEGGDETSSSNSGIPSGSPKSSLSGALKPAASPKLSPGKPPKTLPGWTLTDDIGLGDVPTMSFTDNDDGTPSSGSVSFNGVATGNKNTSAVATHSGGSKNATAKDTTTLRNGLGQVIKQTTGSGKSPSPSPQLPEDWRLDQVEDPKPSPAKAKSPSPKPKVTPAKASPKASPAKASPAKVTPAKAKSPSPKVTPAKAKSPSPKPSAAKASPKASPAKLKASPKPKVLLELCAVLAAAAAACSCRERAACCLLLQPQR